MAARYWVGGQGNWTDTSHWSTTSGGSSGAAVPLYTDDVYIDANSGASNFNIFELNGNVARNLTITNTHTIFFYGGSDTSRTGTFDTYGDITFSSSAHTYISTDDWYIYNNVTLDFNTTGAVAYSCYINDTATVVSDFYMSNPSVGNTGTLKLGADVSMHGIRLEHSGGTFDTDGYDVTFGQLGFYAVTSGTTINLHGSTVKFGSLYGNNYDQTLTSATVNGSSANIELYTSTQTFSVSPMRVNLGGKAYNSVTIKKNSSINNYVALYGNNTIGTLSIDSDVDTLYFANGSTQTVGAFTADGASGDLIKLRPYTTGGTFTIKKTSGTVSTSYLDIQGSTATGGATFNTTNSLDSGTNSGWTFLGPQPPVANFTADDTTPYKGVSVAFTDTSTNTPTSWSWNFGDSGTSTSQNPNHTYTTNGTYTVTLTATNAVGSDVETKTSYITVTTNTTTISVSDSSSGSGAVSTAEVATLSVAGGGTAIGNAIFLLTYQQLAQKDYEYRVFTHDGDFIGIWQNITSDFAYEQYINQTPTELNVSIGRSPNNLAIKLDALLDENSSPITDENSSIIYAQTETANAVGDGSDVDINYNVDVYAFYGGYEQLLDEDGDPILDENSDPILVQFGAPNGKRVYSGYIADYELTYGEQTGVDVVIVPHSAEMDHYVFLDGTDTTVSYGASTDPVQMAIDAMDNYQSQGGIVEYTAISMPLSGETAAYDFNLQTTREVQDKIIELLPAGYYQFVDPGENRQYVLQKADTPHHTFYYEKHIGQLKLRKSITQLINDVYFVGGDTGSGKLYKEYTDATSISTYRRGLSRKSDSRVILASSAQLLSEQDIDTYKDPRYRTSVEISDAVYDIESIKLGQMVAFKNFGTFVDQLVLQIVGIHRKKHTVILDLDMVVPSDTKRLYELRKSLLNEQVIDIGTAPA